MTRKKYILFYIVFFVLFVISLVLFSSGLWQKSTSPVAFCVFLVAAGVSFVAAVGFYLLNRKKLIAYEIARLEKKVQNLDFSVIDVSLTPNELAEYLVLNGYRQRASTFFYKTVEDNGGEGSVDIHYHARLFCVDASIDIAKILLQYERSTTIYNIAYIFIYGNTDQNLEVIKKYIKEAVFDIEIHRYRYKKYVAPIVIADNKMYYIKAGSFISEYRHAVKEALYTLGYNC